MNWFKRKFIPYYKIFSSQDVSDVNSVTSIEIPPSSTFAIEDSQETEFQRSNLETIDLIPSATSFTTVSNFEVIPRPSHQDSARKGNGAVIMLSTKFPNGEPPPLPARPSNFNPAAYMKVKGTAEQNETRSPKVDELQNPGTSESKAKIQSLSDNSSIAGNYSKETSNGGYKVRRASLFCNDNPTSPFEFVVEEEDLIRAMLVDLKKLQGLSIQDISNMMHFSSCASTEGQFHKQLAYSAEYSSKSKASNDGSLDDMLSKKLFGGIVPQQKEMPKVNTSEYQYLTHNIHVDNQVVQMRIGLKNAEWLETAERKEPVALKTSPSKAFGKIPDFFKKASSRVFTTSESSERTKTV